MYLPFLWTIALSFTEYNGLKRPQWVGLDNYRAIFGDSDFATAAGNTGLWVAGTITVSVGLGLVIALLTYNMRSGTWLRLPFLIPFAISGVAVGVMWNFFLSTNGALSQAMSYLHVPGAGARWLVDAPLATIVMILAASWQSVGVNSLLFVIGLQSIRSEIIEAARLDGASRWSLFRAILWPQMAPLTTVVVGLSLVASLKTFDIVWAMNRGGPGDNSVTVALIMYLKTFVLTQYGPGAALAVFLCAITLVASIGYLRRQSRRVEVSG
jgi:multiple sugar transport system permease protein